MTLSIIARHPGTGHLGAAVHTGYLAVGQKVPWVEPGVGAVVTQAITEASYGPRLLGLLRSGHHPEEALAGLLEEDPLRESRQVGVVDALGRVAAHTGRGCIPAAGHAVGDGFVALANMAETVGVWSVMADAFGSASGELPQMLCSAMGDGNTSGGDLRGSSSAAVLVASGDASVPAWDRLVDLRVDDHSQPVAELGRLIRLDSMYALMGRGINALHEGRHDEAISVLHSASQHPLGDDQARFWEAAAHLASGDPGAGEALIEILARKDQRWRMLWERLGPAVPGPADPS
jgi:uncharacterized Ntn-hydrolase superfamily protein